MESFFVPDYAGDKADEADGLGAQESGYEVKKPKPRNIATIWLILAFSIYPLGMWLVAYKYRKLDSTTFTVLSLIFFYPMGIVTMWKYKKFSLAARVIVTVIFAAGTIWTLYGGAPAPV